MAIPRTHHYDRTVSRADLLKDRPKDPATKEPALPEGFPNLSDQALLYSDKRKAIKESAKSCKSKDEKKIVNFSISGCQYCYHCGEKLDNVLPARNTCKIPHKPEIEKFVLKNTRTAHSETMFLMAKNRLLCTNT